MIPYMVMDMGGCKIGIGVDIERDARFRNLTMENNSGFLSKVFTEEELAYCFSKKNSHMHLAARFAAKEAALKSLYSAGCKEITMPLNSIEIFNEDNGAPGINFFNAGPDHLTSTVSLAHTQGSAVAFVLTVVKI